MPHPIVGALIKARITRHPNSTRAVSQQGIALVERIRFPQKGDRAPVLHVRLLAPSPDIVSQRHPWPQVVAAFSGPRAEVPVACVQTVLPGEGEGWVDADEFFDWSES